MTKEGSTVCAHTRFTVVSACALLVLAPIVGVAFGTPVLPASPEDAAWTMATKPGLLQNVTIPPVEPDLEIEEGVDDSVLDPVLEFFPTDQEVREAMSDISSGRILDGAFVILKLFLIPLALLIASGLIILNWRRKKCSAE